MVFQVQISKKEPKESSLKSDPLTSIIIGFTWSIITSINSMKTTLPPLELPGLIKFHL